MKQKHFFKSKNILLLFVILLAVSGCTKKAATETAEKKEESSSPQASYNKEYDRGEVRFRVNLDKTSITIADKIKLVLEATLNKKYLVTFPELTGQLGDFSIQDNEVLPTRAIDKDTLRMVQTYTLEPFLSGSYKIPALTFKYRTEKDTEDNAHLLETEEVPVTVKSLLPEDLEKRELKDVKGPVEPPAPDITWIVILGCGIVLLVGGGVMLGIWLYKRKQRQIALLFVPAHELAFRRLRALVAEDHIGKSAYKLFYGGISTILRHYIEDRFGLRAPESTTEEFLSDIKNSTVLNPEQKGILKDFLKHCDMVKFAELTPATEQIQQTFDLCKNFILQTQDQAVKIEDPGNPDPAPEEQGEAAVSIQAVPGNSTNHQTEQTGQNSGKQGTHHDQI